MKVRIDTRGAKTSSNPEGVRVMLGGEHELPYIAGIDVRFRPDEFIRADIELVMLDGVDIDATADMTALLPDGKRYRLTPLEE